MSLKDLGDVNPYEPLCETASLGALTAREANFGEIVNLTTRDEKEPFQPGAFADELFGLLIRADGQDLSSDTIRALAPEDREAAALALAERFVGNAKASAERRAKTGEADAKPGPDLELERRAEEGAEEYLLRSFRNANSRLMKRTRDLISQAGKGIAQMATRPGLFTGIGRNIAASHKLADQISKMGRGPLPGRVVDVERVAPRFELPPLPPNPVVETNRILREQAEHIAEMRELARTTAEMQSSLNDTALQALGEFNAGAIKAERATSKTLMIALISLAVAVGSVILSIGLAVYQEGNEQKRFAAEQRAGAAQGEERSSDAVAIQRAMASHTAALDRNTAAIDADLKARARSQKGQPPPAR